MQIRLIAALPLTLALAVASCHRREPSPPPRAQRARILAEIPVAAYSMLRDTAGTSEAEQRTYTAVLPFDTTAAFYRAMLPVLGWQVLSDRFDPPAGKIDLYARKGAQTLWVHIQKQTATITQYTLIAAADTTAERAAAPRKDSTR